VTIDATARFENIEASLRAYVDTSLVTGQSMTIDRGHVTEDSSGWTEWVQPRLISVTRRKYHRQVDSTHRGSTVFALFSLNIFLKTADSTNAYRLYELRDLVAQYFTINQAINLVDYAGESATVGTLVVDEIVTDREIPSPSPEHIAQWNITVSLRWLEKI